MLQSITGTNGGEASAQYILDEAEKSGFSVQILPFKNREKKVGHNIMVEISGKSIDKAIVFGAHYDSEKTGMAGSSEFVRNFSPKQLNRIKAYINVDMVGTKNPEIHIAHTERSSNDMEKMLQQNGIDEKNDKPLLNSLRNLPMHVGDKALEENLKAFFKQKNIKIKQDISALTASDTAPFLGKVPVSSIIF